MFVAEANRPRRARLHAALAAPLVSACAATPGYFGPDHLPTWQTAERHQYAGFSVDPPKTDGWWVRVSEQSQDKVIYRHEALERPHTFLVAVERFALEQPSETVEEFGVRLLRARTETPRFDVLETRHERDARWGPHCISYGLRVLDEQVPGWRGPPLELVERGFACLHPTFRNFFVVASWSERCLAGTQSESLRAEGEVFLTKVQIESAPGVPATQADEGGSLRWR